MTDEKEPKIDLKSIPDVSPEEMKRFVMGVCDGRIFTDRHVTNINMLSSVFMVLALGGLEGTDTNTIGSIYEDLSEAGPLSINGMPIFFSCRLMNKKDAVFAFTQIEKEYARRDRVKMETASDLEAAINSRSTIPVDNQQPTLFDGENK